MKFKEELLRPLSVMLVFTVVLTIWVCFSPGFMSYDSMVQYQSALDHRYADSHPAIMSYVWHLCMLLVPGPQSLLYFHLILLALGLFVWQSNCLDVRARLIIPALFLLPWIINFAGVLWKDVGMAFSLLVATGLLFTRRRNIWLLLLAMPFLFYAFGVRHNAIIAVVPILFFAFRYHFPNTRFWHSAVATVLISVALLFSVSVVTYKFINAERKHYETFLMGDDIATISARTHQNLLPWIKEEDLQFCSSHPILYERALCFIGKGYDESGSLVVNLPYEETYTLWEKTIFSNPLQYAAIRLEAFIYFLRPPASQPGFTWFFGIYKNDFDIQLTNPKVADVFGKYMSVIQKTPLRELFKPYVWLLLAIVMFIGAIRRPASLEKTQILVLNGSALGCFFSLLISVPSVDFRYIYWCVIATSISMVIMFFARTSRDAS